MDLHNLLIEYLKNKISKQKLKEALRENNIDYKEFNAYVMSILKGMDRVSIFRRTVKSGQNFLRTNELLDETFVKDIKDVSRSFEIQEFENISRMSQQEMDAKLLGNPQLLQLLSMGKFNPFDYNGINMVLKRCCFEYGIDKGSLDLTIIILDGISTYVKDLVEEAGNEETALASIMKTRFPSLCIDYEFEAQ